MTGIANDQKPIANIMPTPVIMPRQGQSVESCIITKWFKSKGDQISEGDLLFSYETDKAAFEEEAKASGQLLAVFYEEGDEVPVLSNVAVIGQQGDDISPFLPGAMAAETGQSTPPDTGSSTATQTETADTGTLAGQTETAQTAGSTAQSKGGRIRISPLARKVAAAAGLNISAIQGSGPNGRIIERDVQQAMAQATSMPLQASPAHSQKGRVPSKTVATPASAASPVTATTSHGSDHSDEKISNMRRIIATRMAESLQTAAQLTHHISADARGILALRKKVKANHSHPGHVDISLNDMVCHALVKALKTHPEMNAHFLGDTIRSFHKVHLGMAVDTDRGLMVPVLRNADDLNLAGLSNQLKALAHQCRTGQINPELLASEAASFTVTNLGVYGIELFTPVLNLPQVGILGVNTISHKPADLGDGTIGITPVIGLSLTYDHRAVDGAPASRFLKEVKHQIESISSDIL